MMYGQKIQLSLVAFSSILWKLQKLNVEQCLRKECYVYTTVMLLGILNFHNPNFALLMEINTNWRFISAFRSINPKSMNEVGGPLCVLSS